MKFDKEKNDKIRFVGKIVAVIIDEIKKKIRIGMSGKNLEEIAFELMKKNNVKSSSFGYQGFPSYICVSLNNELTHGIPDERKFCNGDLVSFDVACNYQGYHADAASTVIIGKEKWKEKKELLHVTEKSLYHAIKNIKANITTTQDIGEILEKYIRNYKNNNFYPIKEYGGHGIGKSLHEKPFIPNYRTPYKGTIIEKNMFICIEPLVQVGDDKISISSNN